MKSLTFEDAVRIARGCTDYGGGYRSNPEHYEIYQNGINTVINALTAASKTGLDDTQTRALHSMGADHTAGKPQDAELKDAALKEGDFEYSLRTLLAILHRDGGHYANEHGLAKATKDAIPKYYERLKDCST